MGVLFVFDPSLQILDEFSDIFDMQVGDLVLQYILQDVVHDVFVDGPLLANNHL